MNRNSLACRIAPSPLIALCLGLLGNPALARAENQGPEEEGIDGQSPIPHPQWAGKNKDTLQGTAGKPSNILEINPSTSSPTAKLRIRVQDAWVEERGGPTATRIIADSQTYDIPAGTDQGREFPLPANKHKLNPLIINGINVFALIRPKETYYFFDSPCAGWSLGSKQLDMFTPGKAFVRFSARKDETISLGAFQDNAFEETKELRLSAGRTTHYFPVRFSNCRYVAIRTPRVSVLAMENRSFWTLRIDPDGTVTGVVDKSPR